MLVEHGPVAKLDHPWCERNKEPILEVFRDVLPKSGTLLEVGRGHWSADRIEEILAAGDRAAAGPMVPPQGLCLQWVKY